MTQGEAKMLETDVVIFPMELNRENQETAAIEATNTEIVIEKQSIRTDLQIKFARLKKSLPKRAANIL